MMSTIPPAGFTLDYDEEPKTAQARQEVSDSFSSAIALSSCIPLTPPTPASFACRSSLGQQKHLEMKWVSFMATLQESLLVLEASLENT